MSRRANKQAEASVPEQGAEVDVEEPTQPDTLPVGTDVGAPLGEAQGPEGHPGPPAETPPSAPESDPEPVVEETLTTSPEETAKRLRADAQERANAAARKRDRDAGGPELTELKRRLAENQEAREGLVGQAEKLRADFRKLEEKQERLEQRRRELEG